MTNEIDPQARLRWGVYALLVALAAGGMLGRILAVDSVNVLALENHLHAQGRPDWHRQRPFLSANDRSRWATVRSLVEQGTYAIDDIVAQPGWDTIDMVKHRGPDGEEHLYSSKPPLLATLLAGEYWLIYRLTGATLADHPFEIGRFMIATFNVSAMVIYFFVLARLAERLGLTDWGRIFMMAAATFGTFLTTFSVTLNNHIPAAVCAAISLEAVLCIWYDGRRDWWCFALAGIAAALAAANELPALSLWAALGVALAWKSPRESIKAFLPASLAVAAAAFGTNYLAHGSLSPPYMHRGQTDPADNWYDYTYLRDGKERPSYWRDPQGIDRGEPSITQYAIHTTVGHHGIFSLTPVWLLSVLGLGLSLWRGRRRELAVMIASLSVVCFVFYLTRGEVDRNYGGMTSGFRWMFWFAPLWLVALLPAADLLSGSRLGRGAALLLVALSAMSASYPTWNPWTNPWLWDFLSYLGWTT
jgi:hypothetical protein